MYFVDLAALSSAVKHIRGVRADIATKLTTIEGYLANAETPAVWSGPAAGTYTSLVPALQEADRALLAAIDAIADRMQRTADNYVATETTNYYTVKGG